MKCWELSDKDLNFAIESLEGNVNRMCITDSEDELEKMWAWAVLRLKIILEFNKNRIYESSNDKLL